MRNVFPLRCLPGLPVSVALACAIATPIGYGVLSALPTAAQAQAVTPVTATSTAATAAQIDCVFNWAEDKFPTYINPAKRTTQTAGSYLFRYYEASNTYLAVLKDDNHFYFYAPAAGKDGLVDLGAVATWVEQTACTKPAAAPGSASDTWVSFTADKVEAAARKGNDSFVLFDLAEYAGNFMLWGNDWFVSGTTYYCQAKDKLSGTMKLTSSRPKGSFQAGDVMTVEYDNCQEDPEDPSRMSGRVSLRVQAVTGDPATEALQKAWSYQALAEYKDFRIVSQSGISVVNGQMQINESSPGLINANGDESITTSFKTESITMTEDADVHQYRLAQGTVLKNYTAADDWEATISTELHSSDLQGALRISTVTPWKGALGNPFPSAGTGRMEGATGNSIEFTAQPTQVQGRLSTPQGVNSFAIPWTAF